MFEDFQLLKFDSVVCPFCALLLTFGVPKVCLLATGLFSNNFPVFWDIINFLSFSLPTSTWSRRRFVPVVGLRCMLRLSLRLQIAVRLAQDLAK